MKHETDRAHKRQSAESACLRSAVGSRLHYARGLRLAAGLRVKGGAVVRLGDVCVLLVQVKRRADGLWVAVEEVRKYKCVK